MAFINAQDREASDDASGETSDDADGETSDDANGETSHNGEVRTGREAEEETDDTRAVREGSEFINLLRQGQRYCAEVWSFSWFHCFFSTFTPSLSVFGYPWLRP